MRTRFGAHLRENAVAYAALFFALSGVAYAAGPLKPGDPAGGDLTGTYPNPSIAAGAVTGGSGGKVADDTLTGEDIVEPSLGRVGDSDTLDGKDSTSFGAPTEAFATPARFGSNGVILDDQAPPETVLSKAVPAGTYVLLAKVQVFASTGTTATCALEPGPMPGGASDVSSGSVASNGRATLPLMASVTYSSPTTVMLKCGLFQGDGMAEISQLIAMGVDRTS